MLLYRNYNSISDSDTFSSKAMKIQITIAGILTYLSDRRLPRYISSGFFSHSLFITFYENYSSGTVWEFHPIPFYTFLVAEEKYTIVLQI